MKVLPSRNPVTRRTPTVLALHYVKQLRLVHDLLKPDAMLVALLEFTSDPGLRAKFALLSWLLSGATIYRRFATAECISM